MPFASNEFRQALSRFATGVTVVTTRSPAGDPVGLTVNSFSSVSLEPPLVLFSLARTAFSVRAFQHHLHFAVNILREDQRTLADRFAIASSDKWQDVEHTTWESGCPILPNCLTSFECRLRNAYDGGSHLIIVGEVCYLFRHSDGKPLVYYREAYESLELHR